MATETKPLAQAPLTPIPPGLLERSGRVCELQLEGCGGMASAVLRRNAAASVAAALHLCPGCDRWVKARTSDARRWGIRLGPRQTPESEPVLYRGQMVRLAADGGVKPAGQVKTAAGWRSALPWRSIAYRLRYPAVPVVAAGVAAGIAGSVGRWPYLLLAVCAAPAVAWKIAPRLLAKTAEAGQRAAALLARRRRFVLYTTCAATLWIDATALTGLNPHTTGGRVAWTLLPLLWAYPAWRYTAHYRVRPAGPAPVVETPKPAPVVRPSRGQELANLWAEHQPIPDSELAPDRFGEVVGGWKIVVKATKPGALPRTLDGVSLDRVAGVYQVRRGAITWLDEYDGQPDLRLLVVQPKPPLQDTVPWEGTDAINTQDWTVRIARSYEGKWLTSRLYVPGWGAPNRVMLGTTGGGKTGALRTLILSMLLARTTDALGRTVPAFAPLLHDPKRGKDYAEFLGLLQGFSMSREELHLVVDALIREMDRRYDMLRTIPWRDAKGRERRGGVEFQPGVHGPILSLTIDESHENAGDTKLVEKLERLARRMRAAGIQVNLATHMGQLTDWGTAAYRDMISGGEKWFFRTTSSLNRALVGDSGAGDPRELPRVPGLCYFAGVDEQSVLARTAWLPPDDLYDMLYDDTNTPRVPRVELPPETLEAFGPEFSDWRRTTEAGGLWVPPKPGEPAPQPVTGNRREQMLRWLVTQGRPVEFNAIPDATGIPTRTCTDVLRKLVDAGHVANLGGVYEVTPEGVAAGG